MSNLLPYAEQKQIIKMYRTRFVAVVFFALATLLLMASILIAPALVMSRDSENAIASRRDILASHETNTIERTLTQTIDDINMRLGVFPLTAPSSPIVKSFIDPVLTAKTSAIHITQFGINTDPKNPSATVISISGVANTREDLLAYAALLQKVPEITNVLVPIESFLQGSNESFTITANVAQK